MNLHGTFAICGEEGSGKSLISIKKVHDYLIDNRPVISNIDIYLERLMPPMSKAFYIRVPDFPSAKDLWDCGEATQAENEAENGLLLLDEVGVAMNARDWQADGRKQLLEYFRQTMKHGYDKFFLSQGMNSLDSQIRNELIKFVVNCKRTDSIKIPVIGHLLSFFGISALLPKYHVASVKSGREKTAMTAETWVTDGKSYWNSYNRKQKYRFGSHELKQHNGQFYESQKFPHFRYTNTPHGLINVTDTNYQKHIQVAEGNYCVLSAWHLKGRYYSWSQNNYKSILKTSFLIFIIFCFFQIPNIIKAYTTATKIYNQKLVKEKPPQSYEAIITGVIEYPNNRFLLLTNKNQNIYATQKKLFDEQTYFYSADKIYTFINAEKNESSITDTFSAAF